ncbi:MAG: hypothetical protein HOO86_05475 [Bacteroidales bacterium]|nr:hypothetical protein [Bacteroidales bacterium]
MKIVYSFFVLLLLFGCQNNVIFEQTKSFDGQRWNRFDFIETEFEITDIDKLYDLQLNLVNQTTYSFDYISLNVTLYLPGETMRSRDIEIRLQDKNLVWSGEVHDGLVTTHFNYAKGMKFTTAGKVRLRIENKMSKLNLEGVVSLCVAVNVGK